MPTLIFTPRYTDDSQALWKAAGALGWTTERLTGWRIPAHLTSVSNPVIYGEALFGPVLAEQLGLSLLNPPDDWLVRLPHEYKLRSVRLMTLGEARGRGEVAFVKPPNDKSFPAAVYGPTELPTEYPEDMSVLVSGVVQWEKEFRCFILDREVRTFSVYSRFGELQKEQGFESSPDEDSEMLSFVSRVVGDPRVDLPRATVIDVGTIAGAGWACVEQNAAWGAGIYGCDPRAALEVIRNASIKI